jgi:hypothetical protein
MKLNALSGLTLLGISAAPSFAACPIPLVIKDGNGDGGTFTASTLADEVWEALTQLTDQSQPLALPHFVVQPSQPCDLVTCAEAYSVTRLMVTGYSGKLFQLYNGTSTLDIGISTNGVTADMTTVNFYSGLIMP